jgi:hypothetical protein
MGWVRAFWLFGFFWPIEVKIQNREWIPFCKKFCMVFNSILQNNEPRPKIVWVKRGTHPYLFIFSDRRSPRLRPFNKMHVSLSPFHNALCACWWTWTWYRWWFCRLFDGVNGARLHGTSKRQKERESRYGVYIYVFMYSVIYTGRTQEKRYIYIYIYI